MARKRDITGGYLVLLGFMSSPEEKAKTKRELVKDVWSSPACMALIIALVKFGTLKPIQDCLGKS